MAKTHQISATTGRAQMACLSSRIPYGERVTEQKLSMIEQAENLLRDLGFYDVRVRHHELSGHSATVPGKPTIHLARIEVGHSEMAKFLQGQNSTKVAEALRTI